MSEKKHVELFILTLIRASENTASSDHVSHCMSGKTFGGAPPPVACGWRRGCIALHWRWCDYINDVLLITTSLQQCITVFTKTRHKTIRFWWRSENPLSYFCSPVMHLNEIAILRYYSLDGNTPGFATVLFLSLSLRDKALSTRLGEDLCSPSASISL